MATKKERPRPQVFVGSSSESRSLAYAIQQNLDEDADVTVWDQNVFRLTKSTLESLINRLERTDFAVFVFSPDDILRLRGKTVKAVRDNVIFELGLFMGRLGREHTSVVIPKGARSLHIPTDLLGISIGRFNANRADGNFRASLGPFCNEVRSELDKLGHIRKPKADKGRSKRPREKGDLRIIEALYGARDHRINVAHKLNSLIHNGKLHAYIGNQLGDDPCPNLRKDIIVKYVYKGTRGEITVLERDDLDLPPISEKQFLENFDQGLRFWQYDGIWGIQEERTLAVTNSELGGIAKPCLLWKDYVCEFETKIGNKFTSWIVRAENTATYAMLQCQPTQIYPHFRVKGEWTRLDWTKQNPVTLPLTLPINNWFRVRMEVRQFDIGISLIVDGRTYGIPKMANLLAPPIAPVEYKYGSVGFREAGDECAYFRRLSVKKI
jgi:hypothetical protein